MARTPTDNPADKRLVVYVTAPELTALHAAARSDHRSLSSFVRRVLGFELVRRDLTPDFSDPENAA
jgi:hypothetical protein